MALLALTLGARQAAADELTGRTGAAEATPLGALVNPANAAYVRRPSIMVYPSLLQRKTLLIRYPGFRTINETSTGPSIFELPTVVPTSQSPGAKFGATLTQIAPPLGPIGYDLEDLPIVVVNQVNFGDVHAKVKLVGLLGGLVYFKPVPSLAFGLAANFLGAKIDASFSEAGSTEPIAKIKAEMRQISMTFGVRFNPVPEALSIGLASKIYSQQMLALDVDALGQSMSSGKTPNSRFLTSFLGGLKLKPNPEFGLLLDLEFNRADKAAVATSLVDFQEKPRDSYDTLAVRAGGEIGNVEKGRVLLGYAYEPANIGPGAPSKKGPDGEVYDKGKVGFGTIDVIMIYTGFESLRPYSLYTATFQKVFDLRRRVIRGKNSKEKPEVEYYYRWIGAIGLGYQTASLGIDENGERPGAYLQKKISIPIQVGYQF